MLPARSLPHYIADPTYSQIIHVLSSKGLKELREELAVTFTKRKHVEIQQQN